MRLPGEARPPARVTSALVAGLVAGYGIAIPVGAVGAYLVSLSARTSLRTGAAAALGVATVDGGYALLAVVGGSALADAIAPFATVLRWVSAVVLAGVAVLLVSAGVRRYRRADTGARVDAPSPWRAYASLLALTAVNPTTVVYFAALVAGGVVTPSRPAQAAVFVAAAFVASASWQLLLALGGAALGRAVSGSRGRLATALVSGAVVLALAVAVVA